MKKSFKDLFVFTISLMIIMIQCTELESQRVL